MFTAAADYLILEKTEFHKALEKMLDEARSLGANGWTCVIGTAIKLVD